MNICAMRPGALLISILATFCGCSGEVANGSEGNTLDAGDPRGSGGTSGVETGGSGGFEAAGGANGTGGAGAGPGSGGSLSVDAGWDGGEAVSYGGADAGSCPPFSTLDGGVSCSLSLCTTTTGVEIRVTNPDGWYVGALDWILSICDATSGIYRYPGGSLQTLAFPISDAEFAAMDKNASVRVTYGPISSSSRVAECGTLVSILALPMPIGECID